MSSYSRKDVSKFLSRNELIERLAREMPGKSRSTYIMKLQQMVKDGTLVHVGRDAYQFAEHSCTYEHAYSEAAMDVAAFLLDQFPLADFRILEIRQYNAFVVHLLGRNTIFVSVEKYITESFFYHLQERYPGNVLLHPSVDDYFFYTQPGSIIVEQLVTEAPHSHQGKWQTCLEKLLVDLVADKYISSIISPGDFPWAYEAALHTYSVDQRKLFRYARRRNAVEKVRRVMAEMPVFQELGYKEEGSASVENRQ